VTFHGSVALSRRRRGRTGSFRELAADAPVPARLPPAWGGALPEAYMRFACRPRPPSGSLHAAFV